MPYRCYLFFLLLCACTRSTAPSFPQASSLAGKIICLDAGHGGTAQTDSYRVGPTGEREEWVNLRVALLLQELLEKRGATVHMTRTGDEPVPLADRAQLARDRQADLFLSIHHNATADPEVNFPIFYFHGHASENKASVALGRELARALSTRLYQGNTPVSLVSDHTIFPGGGAAVLRGSYGIPGILAEASFFSNSEEEERLKAPEHNRQEALGYLESLEAFFAQPAPPILEKNTIVTLPPFAVLQEAERMNEIARNWYQDYLQGQELMARSDSSSWSQAYELFTRSARSFPDSYVAAACHKYRAALLKRLNRSIEAQEAETRVREFYVPVGNIK
jgi:N-acetylmuramoyl-L-alanine amidase